MFYFSASKSVKFPERQEVTSATHLSLTVKGSYHYSNYVDLAVKFFECVHLKTSATNVVLYLKKSSNINQQVNFTNAQATICNPEIHVRCNKTTLKMH